MSSFLSIIKNSLLNVSKLFLLVIFLGIGFLIIEEYNGISRKDISKKMDKDWISRYDSLEIAKKLLSIDSTLSLWDTIDTKANYFFDVEPSQVKVKLSLELPENHPIFSELFTSTYSGDTILSRLLKMEFGKVIINSKEFLFDYKGLPNINSNQEIVIYNLSSSFPHSGKLDIKINKGENINPQIDTVMNESMDIDSQYYYQKNPLIMVDSIIQTTRLITNDSLQFDKIWENLESVEVQFPNGMYLKSNLFPMPTLLNDTIVKYTKVVSDTLISLSLHSTNLKIAYNNLSFLKKLGHKIKDNDPLSTFFKILTSIYPLFLFLLIMRIKKRFNQLFKITRILTIIGVILGSITSLCQIWNDDLVENALSSLSFFFDIFSLSHSISYILFFETFAYVFITVLGIIFHSSISKLKGQNSHFKKKIFPLSNWSFILFLLVIGSFFSSNLYFYLGLVTILYAMDAIHYMLVKQSLSPIAIFLFLDIILRYFPNHELPHIILIFVDSICFLLLYQIVSNRKLKKYEFWEIIGIIIVPFSLLFHIHYSKDFFLLFISTIVTLGLFVPYKILSKRAVVISGTIMFILYFVWNIFPIQNQNDDIQWFIITTITGSIAIWSLLNLYLSTYTHKSINNIDSNFPLWIIVILLIILSFPIGPIILNEYNFSDYDYWYATPNISFVFVPLIFLTWLLGVIKFLKQKGQSRIFVDKDVLITGIVGLCALLFPIRPEWLFLPITFFIGTFFIWRLLHPTKLYNELQANVEQVLQFRESSIMTLIDLRVAESSLKAFRRKGISRLVEGEKNFNSYQTEFAKYQKDVNELRKKTIKDNWEIANLAFSLGPRNSAWENGYFGAKYSAILAIPWIIIGTWEVLNQQTDWLYPHWFLAYNFIIMISKWLAFGFLLGYFYPYFPGRNGFSKGFFLFLATTLPLIPITILENSSVTNWDSLIVWTIQVFLHCMLLGLFVFDYAILQHSKIRDWRLIFDVHRIPAIGISISSILLAIGTGIATVMSGQAKEIFTAALQVTMAYLVPETQPEIPKP